tara:strand:+ start:512 stop:868 length:357 start_codon:yes stop_codon:yes gene_type:complete
MIGISGSSFGRIVRSLVPVVHPAFQGTQSTTQTQTQSPGMFGGSSFFRLMIDRANATQEQLQRPSLAAAAFKKSTPQDLKVSPLSRGIKTAVGSSINKLKLGSGGGSLGTGYGGNVSL